MAEGWAHELLAGDGPGGSTTAERLMAAQAHATLAVSYRTAELTQAIQDGTAELIYLRHAVEGIGAAS